MPYLSGKWVTKSRGGSLLFFVFIYTKSIQKSIKKGFINILSFFILFHKAVEKVVEYVKKSVINMLQSICKGTLKTPGIHSLNPLRSCDLTALKLTRDSENCQGGANQYYED